MKWLHKHEKELDKAFNDGDEEALKELEAKTREHLEEQGHSKEEIQAAADTIGEMLEGEEHGSESEGEHSGEEGEDHEEEGDEEKAPPKGEEEAQKTLGGKKLTAGEIDAIDWLGDELKKT